MKAALTIIFFTLFTLTVPLRANLWTGTMSWTLTSLNAPDPSGQIGENFTGSYSYESPTENFDSTTYDDQEAFSHFQATINVPAWMVQQGVIGFSGNDANLLVLDGIVTLEWGCDYGPYSANWYNGLMNFGVFGAGPDGSDLAGRGTFTFYAPTDPPGSPVPDTGSTALMLGLALAGLAICRKQAHT